MGSVREMWVGFGFVLTSGIVLLLALKVLWNFGTAYVLIARSRRLTPGQPVSISMHFMLEILLLLLAVLTSLATLQEGVLRPSQIALYGSIAIAASYMHLFLVGKLHTLLSRKPRPPSESNVPQ